MPVGVVAGQAGDLEAQHDPGAAHADFGHQVLEPLPVGSRGPRMALVAVDDHDLFGRPAQGDRPLAQRVLTGGGLGVVDHLPQGRLAHIQVGGAGQMRGGDLGDRGVGDGHRRSPRSQTGERHGGEHTDDPVAVDGTSHLWRCRRHGGGGGAPCPGPGGDAAALQQRQTQPPARGLAVKCPAAQLLIALDVTTVDGALIDRLLRRRERTGPAPVPPNEGAPAPRTARRSPRPDRPSAARGRPPGAGGRRPPTPR
jgi:hypothetical protein